MKLLADIKLDTLQGIGEIGGVGRDLTNKPQAVSFFTFRDTLSLIIGVMTVVGFIWFFFTIVIAAIGWLASGGEKNKVQEAQKKITNGIIGLVILISATFLIKIIEVVLGINILRSVWDILP